MFLLSEIEEPAPARVPAAAESANERLARAELLIDQLAAAAARDDLTGVLRRGAGTSALALELNRALRAARPSLVVAFIDVDGLKEVNDRLGHSAGDRLITDVAALLKRRLRSYDLVIRWGGDEFVCALPGADPGVVAEAMDAISATLRERHGHGVSYGLSEAAPGDEVEALVGRADAALYAARRERGGAGSGRFRLDPGVVEAPDPEGQE